MRNGAAGIAAFVLVATGAALAQPQSSGADERAIRRVVEDAYVSGVFVTRDESAVRQGFHPDFMLSVRQGDELIVAPLPMWLERLELDGVRSADTVTHEFDRIEITGRTAFVKLRLSINDKHVYTDYMGLYRFQDGWKIVNKVFEEHE